MSLNDGSGPNGGSRRRWRTSPIGGGGGQDGPGSGAARPPRRQAGRRRGNASRGSTRQSGRPPLVNAILRAIPDGALALPELSYRQWAALFASLGYPVSRDTLKKAARRGRLELGKLTALTDGERAFARGLLNACP